MTALHSAQRPHHAHASGQRTDWLAIRAAGLLVAALLASVPAAAADGAQLAVDHGCMNCHSNQSRTAPTLKQLTDKLVAKGDSPEVLRHRLAELRGQTGIQGHQSVSDDSLLAILQWMAQGAK